MVRIILLPTVAILLWKVNCYVVKIALLLCNNIYTHTHPSVIIFAYVCVFIYSLYVRAVAALFPERRDNFLLHFL